MAMINSNRLQCRTSVHTTRPQDPKKRLKKMEEGREKMKELQGRKSTKDEDKKKRVKETRRPMSGAAALINMCSKVIEVVCSCKAA